MSNLQRLTFKSHGVQKFLSSKGYDVSGKGKKLNTIMVQFLKEHKLPYKRWNSRYKGLFTADLNNAVIIQDNWKLFKKWINQQQ